MTTDAKTLEKIDREEAEEVAELMKQELMDAIDNGLAIMVPGKPAERLQGFLAQTYSEDIPVIMDETYADRRRDGTAQPLMAEIALQAYSMKLQQIERALAMGVDPALPELQPPPAPLTFWAETFELPWGIDVYERFAADFRRLMREEGKKILAAPVEPVAVGAY